MHKILIVEDEPAMLSGLKDNLEFEGYQVTATENGKKGFEYIKNNKYDLVLLDVMLPDMSGFEICKNIRKHEIKTPIILLTAKSEEIDKVLGLELGADDYITKPFSLRELLARIKAVLRRVSDSNTEKSTSGKVEIGRLIIDFDGYSAYQGDQEIKMTHKEIEIIRFLIQRANKIVSRDEIIEKIWEDNYQPTTRTIDNFILKLRQKIESDPNTPKLIHTVHGVGYKLIYDND